MVDVQLLDVEDLAGGRQRGLALPLAGAPGCFVHAVVANQASAELQNTKRVGIRSTHDSKAWRTNRNPCFDPIDTQREANTTHTHTTEKNASDSLTQEKETNVRPNDAKATATPKTILQTVPRGVPIQTYTQRGIQPTPRTMFLAPPSPLAHLWNLPLWSNGSWIVGTC